MKEEVWKPINGYEGIYEVSSFGRVRSLDRIVYCKNGTTMTKKGRIMKGVKPRNGYRQVRLSKDGEEKPILVHRLVALHFIPNPDSLPQVNHKDENKQNNRVDNLEWCSVSYNATYNNTQERRYSNGGGRRKRAVDQLTLDGEFIRSFPSISEAARTVGAKDNAIIQACQGRFKTSCGYRWRYAE